MQIWRKRISKRLDILRGIQGFGHWWLFIQALVFAASVPMLLLLKIQTLGRLLELGIGKPARIMANTTKTQEIAACVESAIAFAEDQNSLRTESLV